jgi:hypothetical protein
MESFKFKIVGIDPGLKGGICIMDQYNKSIHLYKMPVKNKVIDYNAIKNIINSPNIKTIILEYTTMIFGTSKHTAWEMGRQIGIFEGLSNCFYLELFEVSPRKWQNYIFKSLYSEKLKHIPDDKTKLKSKKIFVDILKEEYFDYEIYYNNRKIERIKLDNKNIGLLSAIHKKKNNKEIKIRMNDGITDSFCITLYYVKSQTNEQ